MRRLRPPRLSAEARSARVRPPDSTDRAQAPAARRRRSARCPAAARSSAGAGPPEATPTSRPPRGVGPLGQGGELAVGGRDLELGLDRRGRRRRAGCARRRRAGRPRTSSTAPGAGRARPRRGAARAPSSVHVTDGDARAVGRVRVADREGDEQAVARDQAAVGVADAHGQPGRDLHGQLDRPAAARRSRRTPRRRRRRGGAPRRRARAARRAGRRAGGGPSRSLQRARPRSG